MNRDTRSESACIPLAADCHDSRHDPVRLTPLYEDQNNNGIDDAFEQKQRGRLLSNSAASAERAFFAEQWKAEQREKGVPILNFKRPLPDRALTAASAAP